MDSVKKELQEIVSVLDCISKQQYDLAGDNPVEVTSPDFCRGYSMAYDMASFRIKKVLREWPNNEH